MPSLGHNELNHLLLNKNDIQNTIVTYIFMINTESITTASILRSRSRSISMDVSSLNLQLHKNSFGEDLFGELTNCEFERVDAISI